jgi:hypothetical protein
LSWSLVTEVKLSGTSLMMSDQMCAFYNSVLGCSFFYSPGKGLMYTIAHKSGFLIWF